jgi:hypothetical protein
MFIQNTVTPTIVAATAIIGAAIVVFAALSNHAPPLQETGTCLRRLVMVAPFALNYGDAAQLAHRAWRSVAALAILELWQDRDRQFGM